MQLSHQPPRPTAAHLGRSLPAAQTTITWNAWVVVDRSPGFHVSRESGSGQRHEALKNEVGRTKVFRSRLLAERACAQANFTADAQRLAGEALLGGKGTRSAA